MNKVPTNPHVSNRHVANLIEARCHCGRTIALCAATYIAFCDEDGMKAPEREATCVLLNCHALEHGAFGQTLMVALFETAVAA